MAKYSYIGAHADTIYKGDKAIPVGHGMDPIDLTDKDFEDERNVHLKDSFILHSEAATVETEPTPDTIPSGEAGMNNETQEESATTKAEKGGGK